MTNAEHHCQECLAYSKYELSQQGWLCDECLDKKEMEESNEKRANQINN